MSDSRRCMSQFGCGQLRPLSDYDARDLAATRFEIMCRACKSRNHYIRRHGISQSQRDQLALEQGGCAVCGCTDPGSKGWVVDHDHSCCGPHRSCEQCRRGIVCHRCNMVLGLVRDDADLLVSLADYLRAKRYANRIAECSAASNARTERTNETERGG